MSQLITTKEFISKLQEQDPTGDRIIYFQIMNFAGEKFASGELEENNIFVSQRSAHNTTEGDKPVVLVNLNLDCDFEII